MTARSLIFALAAASAVVAMTNTVTAVAEPETEADAGDVIDSPLSDAAPALTTASLGASCAASVVPTQLIATAGAAVPKEIATAGEPSAPDPASAEIADPAAQITETSAFEEPVTSGGSSGDATAEADNALVGPTPDSGALGSVASTEEPVTPGGICGAAAKGNVLIATASAASAELAGGMRQADEGASLEPADELDEFPQEHAEATSVEAQPEVERVGDPESAAVMDDEGSEEAPSALVEAKPSRTRTASQAPRKESAPPMAEVEVPTGPWWPAKAEGRLNLTFAGEAAFSGAIALLFDGAFETSDSANQNIHVTSKNGAPIKGQWVVATNRQMLLFRAAPGRYVVKVGESLQDGSGRTIAAAAQGVVQVAH